MLPRDERRFKAADLNGDERAERDEFTAFLHPEEFEHMRDIVVLVSGLENRTGLKRNLKLPELNHFSSPCWLCSKPSELFLHCSVHTHFSPTVGEFRTL